MRSVPPTCAATETTVRQQVTHFNKPGYFAYRVWEFGNPIIHALATSARSEWTFTAAPGGTHVSWTYTVTAKNAVAAG